MAERTDTQEPYQGPPDRPSVHRPPHWGEDAEAMQSGGGLYLIISASSYRGQYGM
jgi:hypothetical protein